MCQRCLGEAKNKVHRQVFPNISGHRLVECTNQCSESDPWLAEKHHNVGQIVPPVYACLANKNARDKEASVGSRPGWAARPLTRMRWSRGGKSEEHKGDYL